MTTNEQQHSRDGEKRIVHEQFETYLIAAAHPQHVLQQGAQQGRGHGHGGLVRLPFTDGLVSVERTFFPSYTAGFYQAGGADLFVSRGLGNNTVPFKGFRLFNRPEVAVVTLRSS